MASFSALWFLKSRLFTKSRLFNAKFHFGHKIATPKSRLYVKSRFVKLRLYCIRELVAIEQLIAFFISSNPKVSQDYNAAVMMRAFPSCFINGCEIIPIFIIILCDDFILHRRRLMRDGERRRQVIKRVIFFSPRKCGKKGSFEIEAQRYTR